MNTNYINACLRWLTNELFPYYLSRNLPEELLSKIDVFYSSISKTIDWYNLAKSDLLKLGFLNWDDESSNECTSATWFIPCWLFPLIPEGITLYDTSSKAFKFKSTEASTKSMYGCLTYGVKVTSSHDTTTLQGELIHETTEQHNI